MTIRADANESALRAGGRLRVVTLRAMRWQTLATVVGQMLFAAVTLTAAKVTAPDELALWGIAIVIFNAQNLIGSLGLGQALVYRQEDERTRDAVDGAFVVTAVLGIGVASALFCAAPTIAAFFSKGFSHDEVETAVKLMSIVFACTTVANVPQALVEKTLNFKRRAIPDLLGSFGYAATSCALLVAGLGIWSLIIAKVLQSILLMIVFWVVAPIRPRLRPRFHWPLVHQLLSYGKFASAAAMLGFLIANFDSITIGRWAGAAALGGYALAYSVTNLAPTFLSATLGKVFFPLYASVRSDEYVILRAYHGALHYVTIVMLPISLALATFAPSILVDVFGNRWSTASSLIPILAFYALARAFAAAATTLLAASGRPQLMLTTQVVNFATTLASLPVAIGFGVTGIACAFTAGQAGGFVVALLATRSLLDVGLVHRLTRPIAASAIALTVAWLAGIAESGASSDYLAAAVFTAIYLGALFVLDEWVRALSRDAVRHIAGGVISTFERRLRPPAAP